MTIQDGDYTAKPTCWGFITTKNGNKQFAVEFELQTGESTMSMTWFQGFDHDVSFDILRDGLTACGWSGDFENIELDTSAEVRVKVASDGQYGPKISKVYGNAPGLLVRRQAVPAAEAKSLAQALNARMRASGNASAAPQSRTQQRPQQARPAQPSRTAPMRPPPPRVAPAHSDNLDPWQGDVSGNEEAPF